jgi:hypothetical protein
VTDNGVAGSRAVELEADLALVALDEKDLDRNDRRTHALELISQLVHEARCPVIAVIENENPDREREPGVPRARGGEWDLRVRLSDRAR